MPNLSSEQREAVELRDCNILVSAAAGSGKTTILVERIIQRIKDEKEPVNIDEILVLTFTKAAAGEMRDRIATAIEKELLNNPEDEHMQKQSMLIYNAQITTIDSFCLSILKNNFAEIGLEPGFRLAKEAEMTFLTEDVLDETVEELLANRDLENIDIFLNRFESKDNVNKIKQSILEAYKEADKAPFPEEYFDIHKRDYDVKDEADLCSKDWFIGLWDNITLDIKGAKQIAEELLNVLSLIGPEEYIANIESDIEFIEELENCGSYRELWDYFSKDIKWQRLNKCSASDDLKLPAQDKRKLYKDLIDKIKKDYFSQSISNVIENMQETSKAVTALMEATKGFYHNLEAKKREMGLITFSDMEHMALKILLHKEEGEYLPTRAALEYRDMFKELMIDEYQDSNYIQEALIHSISGEDEGRFDRFMVGDIKQSIYRFRNANPELFVSKYLSYTKGTGDKRRIDLSKNYRSRTSVIDMVNTVFERIMDKDVGGVDYDADSRLYCGITEPLEHAASDRAELLIADANSVGEVRAEELESLMIAKRIKSLMQEYKVWDSKQEIFRACTYRDIVILVRSGGAFTDSLKRVMEEQGIPAYVTSKTGYFNTLEIVTLLNFLSVLNNPYNDTPLFGTMLSLFGEFDENEVASLKILCQGSLYEALKYGAEFDIEGILEEREELRVLDLRALKDKSIRLLKNIESYRRLIPFTPINELLRLIINNSRYLEYMSALPMGNQRRANILMLLKKAASFEQEGFRGLFNFNRYIEKLHKYESDEGEVVTLDENADVVRIMTMHKSKGLEFPICILANLSKKMNRADERAEVIYHNKYGLGLNYIDYIHRAKYQDMRKKFIASAIHKDSLSEELRVLYVAMTRAKEKLIMTAVSDKLEEYGGDRVGASVVVNGRNETSLAGSKSANGRGMSGAEDESRGGYEQETAEATETAETAETAGLTMGNDSSVINRLLPRSMRLKISSYLDAITLAKEEDNWNNNCDTKIYTYDDLRDMEVVEAVKSQELYEELRRYIEKADISVNVDSATDVKTTDLLEHLDFVYAHENLKNLYTKTSVSELKLKAINDGLLLSDTEEVSHELFATSDTEEYIPSFVKQELKEASGATRGSAYHRVMELMPFNKITDEINIIKLDELMEEYLATGELLKEEYTLVDKEKICIFLHSDLGKRMIEAAKGEKLYLEQPFVLGISADRLSQEFPKEETILIQGIIDGYFIEDNQIILMDYKTDRVRLGKELVDKYRIQLDYYKEALERIAGLRVKEMLIYSFHLDSTITV